MDFGSIFEWLEILGLFFFLLTILNLFFQVFVRKKSVKSIFFGTDRSGDSQDSDETKQKNQAAQTSHKKTAFIAIFVVFNISFFYWILEYRVLFE